MQPTLPLLVGFALGAAAMGAAWVVFGCAGEAAPAPSPSSIQPTATSTNDTEAATGAGHRAALGARLSRVEEQLSKLIGEISALRRTGAAPQRQPSPADSDTPLDETALAAALDRAEQQRLAKRLDGLNDAQLLAEAKRLKRSDPLTARATLEFMLRRQLPPAVRAQALTEMGVVHRRGGDLAAAEASFQDAVRAGTGSEHGAWAAYQLAMTVSQRGEDARALAIAKTIASGAGASKWIRLHGEWADATLTEKLGDIETARAHYQRILVAARGDEQYDWLVEDLEKRLGTKR